MAIFTGAGVALITPFNEDGSVNYSKLEMLIEDQIAGGTDCIIACGTTGEASTLTHEEHLDVVRKTIEIVNGRIPVVAGTGSNCTDTAIYLSKEAEKMGADGLLIVSPYYNKGTQKGLIRHYTEIANSVQIPILLYNVPSRTGVNIVPSTIAHLVKNVKNIVGVKEAGGNISEVAELFRLCKDMEIDVYTGNDDQIVPVMSLGGIGVISVISNIAPKQTHDLCQAMLCGDYKEAAKMQLDMLDVIHQLFVEVNPIPVKAAMNLMGMEVGGYRLPLTEIEAEHKETLRKSMQEYGLLE